jgi:hypothetical protein
MNTLAASAPPAPNISIPIPARLAAMGNRRGRAAAGVLPPARSAAGFETGRGTRVMIGTPEGAATGVRQVDQSA